MTKKSHDNHGPTNRDASTRDKGRKRSRKRGALRTVNRLTAVTIAGLVVGSVVQELRKPIDKRTWEGRVVGVPYDYRKPTVGRLRATWWAPEDARVVVPTAFGVGWDLNVGRVTRVASQKWSDVAAARM